MGAPLFSPLPAGHIRLLELFPGADKAAPLHCSISSTASTSQALEAVSYEAVSYKWGRGEECFDLHLPNGTTKISKNLDDLLRALRPTRSTRTLWIDRICVNQNDAKEVYDHFALMDVVYERAERTLSWLGCSTTVTQSAVEVLHSLALLSSQHLRNGTLQGFDYRPCMITKRYRQSSVFPTTCNEIMIEGMQTDKPHVITLERRAKLPDEQIFRFDDQELWHEIDGILTSSYFRRTWIEREVAKAKRVQVCRGEYNFPWPILRWAFIGRFMLHFQPWHPLDASPMALGNVIDARERWRTPGLSTTLAGSLMTFCYSEESRLHDRIRAAHTLAKQKIEGFDQDHGGLPIEEFMRRVACASIQERHDLYHLGFWCVASRKTMALPSWAPDYKSGCCELAVQFASRETSLLIRGSYVIDHDRLSLNAHLLDEVEWSHPIGNTGDLQNILPIIQYLDTKFRKSDPRGIFGEYVGLREGWMETRPAEQARREVTDQLSQAESVLRSTSNYPLTLLETLRYSQQNHRAKVYPAQDYQLRTIEALWSLLNPANTIPGHARSRHGEQLFLAWLYFFAMLNKPGRGGFSGSLPKSYGDLLMAVLPTVVNAKLTTEMNGFIWQHLRKTMISQCEPECVFVTKNGWLGRTVAGEAKPDRIVAFLQGGFTPFLLKKEADLYRITSFAFIEGLEDVKTLPPGSVVENICLK